MTDALSDAWRTAGRDLGIDVIAPFDLVDMETQERIVCIALVKSFGAIAGTVVIGRHASTPRARSIAKSRGLHFSMLDERSFADYERGLFVDTLNDWGWYGDKDGAPSWFSGEPWTA